MSDGFHLGDGVADWWADMVSANIAVTHNCDGRHRGGPDHAFVIVDGAIKCFGFGDFIARPQASTHKTEEDA